VVLDIQKSFVFLFGKGMPIVGNGLFPFFPNGISSFIDMLVVLQIYLRFSDVRISKWSKLMKPSSNLVQQYLA
jgi:hypothetical protein